MENIIKGWITSAFGILIMIGVFLHFFGFYTFPNPTALTKNTECAIAFVIGLILFLVPASKIEGMLESKTKDLIDKTGK